MSLRRSYHKTQKTTQQARIAGPILLQTICASFAQVPRGFYETRQRIRAAYEIREKVLQQQEAAWTFEGYAAPGLR